ncbi:MAG: hypothetical protein R6U16_06615, partial [Desulfotignum sp.]
LQNGTGQWKFTSTGYALNNEEVDLNKVIKIKVKNTILFGTLDEPLYLTRLLAPKMSRSFVLANANITALVYDLIFMTVDQKILGSDRFEICF